MNGDNSQNRPAQGQESFFSRHSKAVVRLVIIAVIIVGAVIYSRSQPTDNQTSDGEQATEQTDGTENGEINGMDVTDRTDDGTEVKVVEEKPGETIRVTGQRITVVVQKGNGYTHTARRALAQYLETHSNSEIKAEHKIFIEDYLQKKISEKKRLFVGDEVNFEQSEIEEAIDAALNLNGAQVQSLSKYVPLVPGLM